VEGLVADLDPDHVVAAPGPEAGPGLEAAPGPVAGPGLRTAGRTGPSPGNDPRTDPSPVAGPGRPTGPPPRRLLPALTKPGPGLRTGPSHENDPSQSPVAGPGLRTAGRTGPSPANVRNQSLALVLNPEMIK